MKKMFILILMVTVFASLFSQTWKIDKTEANQVTLSRDDGKVATAITTTELSLESVAKIGSALNAAWSMPGLKADKASVQVDTIDSFRFVIYPTEFKYQDIDLKSYLPSGIAFQYNTTLFYDIVLKVKDVMPKISGAYISPDDVLKLMREATIMPERFMSDMNIQERLQKLENAIMAISKKGLFKKASSVSDEVVLAIRSLYNENPKITRDEAAEYLKSQGIEASSSDINAVFMVHLGNIE